MAPTEEPTTRSGITPCSTSARSMPTCTAPKLPPPASTNAVLVAIELFTADVVLAYARAAQGLLHGEHHRGRPDHVIHRCVEPGSCAPDQCGIDEPRWPGPRAR